MNINLAMIEPTDDGVLEDLVKKRVHHGEEALMFAVLKSATEDFQKLSMHETARVNYYSMKRRNGSSKKILIHSFVSKVSVRFYGFNPTICVKDCSGGKRRIVSPRPLRSSHYKAARRWLRSLCYLNK